MKEKKGFESFVKCIAVLRMGVRKHFDFYYCCRDVMSNGDESYGNDWNKEVHFISLNVSGDFIACSLAKNIHDYFGNLM